MVREPDQPTPPNRLAANERAMNSSPFPENHSKTFLLPIFLAHPVTHLIGLHLRGNDRRERPRREGSAVGSLDPHHV